MRRLSTLLVLICFAATFLSNSIFMLSIENENVYTEIYNLSHIIQATSSYPAENYDSKQEVLGSCRYLKHRHIKLTRCSIPEDRFIPAGAYFIYANLDFFPTSPAFSSSSVLTLTNKKFDPGRILKLPISPLQQSSILLI